jgi:predicted PurR-regulated permease PerM
LWSRKGNPTLTLSLYYEWGAEHDRNAHPDFPRRDDPGATHDRTCVAADSCAKGRSLVESAPMIQNQDLGGQSAEGQASSAAARGEPGAIGSFTPHESYVEKVLAVILLLGLALGCLAVLQPFLAAMLWATILSFSTWPVYARLERLLNGRRGVAALVMTLGAAALLLVPLVILGARVTGSLATLIEALRLTLANGLPPLPSWIAELPLVGTRLAAFWERAAHDSAVLNAAVQPYFVPARDWLIARGGDLLQGILQVSLSLIVAFFFYRDGPAVLKVLDAIVARLAGARSGRLLRAAGGTINGVVRGVLGTSLIQAILMASGLWLAGVPGAVFLGLVSFFLSLIPMALALIWIPAAIWLASKDAMAWAGFIAIWGALVGQIDNVLRPYLIRKGSELPTLLIFLGVLGGALVFGFIGIFLGPTLLAVGYSLVQEWGSNEAAAVPARHQTHAGGQPGRDVALPAAGAAFDDRLPLQSGS